MPESIMIGGRICNMSDSRNDHLDGARGSISIHFVHDALAGARRQGVDTAPLLAAAGIPPERLEATRARVSPRQYATLWRALADLMDDEFFGLDSHPMRRGSFRLMCHSVLTSRNLEQAMRRAMQVFAMVLDDTRPELVRFEDCAAVVLHDRHPAVPLFAHGTLLMILQGLACWLTDRRIALIGADLAQPEPIHGEEYRVLFGRETRFGRGRTVLRFDATALALAVVRRPADLRDFLQAAPANFLVRYRNPDSLAARIRHSLRRREPADWPDFDTLAKQFNASASTLRRRLDEEGQSYQGIKDALRRDMAIELLGQGDASVLEVAQRIGFAEASAFHRAFRKWTGASPASYRERAEAGPFDR